MREFNIVKKNNPISEKLGYIKFFYDELY